MYFNGSHAGSSDLCLQPTGLGWAEVTGTCGSGVGMKSFTVWPGPLPSSWLYASTSVCFAGNWTLHITHHNFFSWNHCFQHYLEYRHTAEKPTIREKNIVYFGLTKLRNIVLIYCLIKMEEWFLVYYCCCCYHLYILFVCAIVCVFGFLSVFLPVFWTFTVLDFACCSFVF